MQAAVFFSPSLLPLVSPNKSLASARRVVPRLQTSQCSPIKASAPVANDTSTVDYSSVTSVFPAEACETVGGEACDVEMYPEVKLKPDARSTTPNTSEQIDREYVEYSSAKTVFVLEKQRFKKSTKSQQKLLFFLNTNSYCLDSILGRQPSEEQSKNTKNNKLSRICVYGYCYPFPLFIAKLKCYNRNRTLSITLPTQAKILRLILKLEY